MAEPRGREVPTSSPDYVRQGEWVIIDLPLSLDAVVAIGRGLEAAWPDCVVLGDLPPQYRDKMVVELRGDHVEFDDPDDV